MIIGIDIGKRRGKERNTPGYFFRAATAERKNAEMGEYEKISVNKILL